MINFKNCITLWCTSSSWRSFGTVLLITARHRCNLYKTTNERTNLQLTTYCHIRLPLRLLIFESIFINFSLYLFTSDSQFFAMPIWQQVTWLASQRSEEQSHICLVVHGAPWWALFQHSIMLWLFFIVECGIAHFLGALHVFELRALSSSPRLPLCQILFLLWPPLLS